MQSQKSDKSHSEAVIKRVSRRHDDEGHGGAWKVAFADFCLALMCLFLVMWVLAARNQERAEEVLRAVGGQQLDEGRGVLPEGGPRGSLISREPLPRDPEAQPRRDERADRIPPRKVRYESAAELAELAQTLQRLSHEAGLTGNLQSVITPQGLRVMVHDTDKQGMFVRGSAVPSERFRRLLREMGPLFARIENQMLIVGHTDAVPYAAADMAGLSNWALSTHRAMAARAQLLAGGMPSDSILQVVGMADRAPLDTRDPRAGLNRRIELLILTPTQARHISAMFGMPAQTTALNPEVRLSAPDAGTFQALRPQLSPQPDTAGAR